MTVFHYQKDQHGIVTITMDMTGPVNVMNAEYAGAMAETIDKLEAESDLVGVIFASAKKTFFAGGDLNMLLAIQPGDEESLFKKIEQEKSWLRRLEFLPVPVVAAINGAALGGGYELCLACNYRIAVNHRSTILGLPEVTLGLLPGAGGVVRLTNLLGLEKALPLLLEGKKLSGEKALATGMVDELVTSQEVLNERAMAWILEQQSNEGAGQQPWDQKGFKLPGGDINHPSVRNVSMFAPYALREKTRGLLPAPELILDTAVEAIKLTFDTALRIETRNFTALAVSKEAKNLITAFFFQLNQVNGGANRPQNISTSVVSRLGVIGAGMMGQGIANVAAMAGIDVVLKDMSQDAAEKGKAYTEVLLDKAISRGRADSQRKAEVLGRITATDKLADLSGCDLIVEAVFENLELKHQITKDAEGFLTKNGVWGSNTSTLPITSLAKASDQPDKFIGIHFFSPVDKMPLVELICGEETSDETLARAFDFVRQIKKTPIVVNDHVGFFTSRTFSVQLFEAAQLVAEGVHPIRVDNLGKAIGMPVGPLTVHDEVSLKLTLDVIETQQKMGLQTTENERAEGMALIVKMVKDCGRGGRHYGGGYFDYASGQKEIWPPLIDDYHQPENGMSDQDIKDRLLFGSVIESLRCLEEGVLRSVADGNIGSILGIGAPAWTGGYIQFVNGFGLANFIARCDELSAKYGRRFQAPLIVAKTLSEERQFN